MNDNHSPGDVKTEVRQFYDQIGWQLVDEETGVQITPQGDGAIVPASAGELRYQNARFEDLRPVSREYIHRCHLRPARHLNPSGRYLLDAGCGPIQYPEYLEYSRGYRYRVCADISITALLEARKRIGEHGLFVVADIANLPFKPGAFEGVISLHTIHHLPEQEHLQAYQELHRLLAPGGRAVVVNGWPSSPMMLTLEPLVRLANRLRWRFDHARFDFGRWVQRKRTIDGTNPASVTPQPGLSQQPGKRRKVKAAFQDRDQVSEDPRGTFTNRHDAAWVKSEIGSRMPLEILVWRSVSVRFLRALIHPRLGGRYWLRLIYWLEERKPHYFGEKGQYPLIIIARPAGASTTLSDASTKLSTGVMNELD